MPCNETLYGRVKMDPVYSIFRGEYFSQCSMQRKRSAPNPPQPSASLHWQFPTIIITKTNTTNPKYLSLSQWRVLMLANKIKTWRMSKIIFTGNRSTALLQATRGYGSRDVVSKLFSRLWLSAIRSMLGIERDPKMFYLTTLVSDAALLSSS